jgi:3-oxoacyl-[acyl-carrier-protein] synthase II
MIGQADRRRRVVVTGLGCVSPMGADAASTWAAVAAGRSGVAALRSFDAADLSVRIAAECDPAVGPQSLPPKEARRLDRCTRLALVAAEEAVADAAWTDGAVDPARTAVVVGTSIGGIATLLEGHDALRDRGPRRIGPFVVPMTLPNMTAGFVSMHWGLRGPIGCPVGACASGAQAIATAARLIERGDADAALAGGTEAAILPLVVAGFAAMRALSIRNHDPARASRPFDRARDGFVMGEGAAIVVLEAEEVARARAARVRARWLGYGEAADASHPASPPDDGHGARLAIERALADADLPPSAVEHVSAHATSTPAGDRAEAVALRAVFGTPLDRIPVSATKSSTGHLLGAAGALAAILSVQALETGLLPPTINLDDPDPDCMLDHVAHKARPHPARVALVNAFGFGGVNASILLGRAA